MNVQAAPARLQDQTTQGGVLLKLSLFSLALGILPIGTYFSSLKYIWDGNDTYAAICAIIAANGVLVAYIIVAILEDRDTSPNVAAPAPRPPPPPPSIPLPPSGAELPVEPKKTR